MRKFLGVLGCVWMAAAAMAVDTRRFELLKGVHYYQVSSGGALLQTNNMYRFSAQVYATQAGAVRGSSFITPRGSRIDLLPDRDGDPYRFRDRFDDFFGLDHNYPDGVYTFGISALNDGDRTMEISIAGAAYPEAPVIANYEALQNLPYNMYNEVAWRPFQGAAASDFIQLQIEDVAGNNIWETPDFGEPGALNGLATGTIIPAGELKAGQLYVGLLRFTKVVQGASQAYPGVAGLCGYFARTEFTLRADGNDINADVDRVEIWKTRRATQLPGASPTLHVRPWEFFARADTDSHAFLRGRVATPKGLVQLMLPDSDFAEFEFDDDAIIESAPFETQYPAGAYAVSLERTSAPPTTVTLNLPEPDYPPAPHLQNLPAAAELPQNTDLVVAWAPWTTFGAMDFIRVELEDEGNKIFDTPNYASVKRLHPSETTVTIASTNFVPGHAYRLFVTFANTQISDTRALPGALVFGGHATRTRFDFSVAPPNVPRFGVTLTRRVWQRGEGIYEPHATLAHTFEAAASPSRSGALVAAQANLPGVGETQLTSNAGRTEFNLLLAESSEEALLRRFPTGVYPFRFETANDGIRTSSATLNDHQFPPLPFVRHLSNYVMLRPTAANLISWQLWTGADTNRDTVEFSLFNSTNGAVNLGTVELTPTSTNVVIPVDTLRANQSYTARLRFIRGRTAEQATYPGARGNGALVSETSFYLSTLARTSAAAPNSPFAMSGLVSANGRAQFRIVPTLTGRSYRIWRSEDLLSWTAFQTNTASATPGQTLTVQIPIDPLTAPSFFRTSLMP